MPLLSRKPDHIPDARLFRIAVAASYVFSGAEYSHLKECAVCSEQWKRYIRDYVRDEKTQDNRMKRAE